MGIETGGTAVDRATNYLTTVQDRVVFAGITREVWKDQSQIPIREQYFLYASPIEPIYDSGELEDFVDSINHGRLQGSLEIHNRSLTRVMEIPELAFFSEVGYVETRLVRTKVPNLRILHENGLEPSDEYASHAKLSMEARVRFYPHSLLAEAAFKRHRRLGLDRFTAGDDLVNGYVTERQLRALQEGKDPFEPAKTAWDHIIGVLDAHDILRGQRH